jgi:hypothetical protein
MWLLKTQEWFMRPRLAAMLTLIVLSAGPTFAAAALSRPSPDLLGPAQPSRSASRLIWLAAGALAFGMAIRIKDTASLAQKFVTRASAALNDYTSGVQAAGSDWETNTKAAETSYQQGVQEAISKGRFGRGVANAGQAKYVANAVKLGGQRYGPGVQNAQDAWARGVAPALDRLKSLQLPPRGPRRSPANQQRANMVALELGKLKDGQ